MAVWKGANAMDRISLHGLQCYGYHGVFAEENKLGQRFIVDLELELDLLRAGTQDELAATVNYAEIAETTKQLVEGKPFQLVEAVAEAIAQRLLKDYPLLHSVFVRVHKPNPPVPLPFDGVSVTLHRARPTGETVFIALGANIGEREQQLRTAIAELRTTTGIEWLGNSTVYQTQPVGVTDQPLFLNMVVALRTVLSVEALFARMMSIELEMGRTRDVHWGPRLIDLDLLYYGEMEYMTNDLMVPHPRLAERAFVLAPLLDVVKRFAPQRELWVKTQLEARPDKGDVLPWMIID
jgi:dihydroneopterin aldolase/2-amino-4-hydroxy-6-hydroxymethyldihydropteridine diphosphokinase